MQEPLVLLPGMMCDSRLFAPQLAVLSREYPVTVAPLAPGERLEEIAAHLLKLLPEKFALAGMSMGGILAMEILRRAPDRVARVALIATNALSETPQSATAYEPLIIKARAGKLEEALRQMMRPEFLAPGPQRMTILNSFVQMGMEHGPETFVRLLRALQRRRDQQAVLRRCKCPALLLVGQDDGLTPVKRHQLMAELIPYAELKVIPEAGHMLTLEQPEAVTEALRQWMHQPYVLRA